MSILQLIFAVDTKIGFERPVQDTLGWPSDFNAFEISDLSIGSMDRSDRSVCNRNKTMQWSEEDLWPRSMAIFLQSFG